MAVHEWFRMQESSDFYRDRVSRPVPSWERCVSVLVDYVEMY